MELVWQKIREMESVRLLGIVYVSTKLGAASGPQALRGMQNVLQRRLPSPGGNPWLFVGLVFIAVVSFGIIVKKKVTQTGEAHEHLRKQGFTPDEITLLDKLAKCHERYSAVGLTKDERSFNAAAEDYLKQTEEGDQMHDVFKMMQSIRRKASFDNAPTFRLYGTFALQPGDVVRAVVNTGESSEDFSARVLESENDDLCVASAEGVRTTDEGEMLEFYVLGNNSRLRGQTRILSVDEEEGICHLAHSVERDNADRRRSHRVVVDEPVTYIKGGEESQATLHDLSAHGASLVDVSTLEEGDDISVILSPDSCLPPTSSKNHPDSIEISGMVLPVRKHGPRSLYPVEWQDLTDEERQPLYHLVQDIEVHRSRE